MIERRADPRLLRLAALAGMIGPVLLAGAIVVLTVAQYDFIRSLRWDPLTAPTVDWPSGLSLGPYGGWMVAAFVTCGLLLPGFALYGTWLMWRSMLLALLRGGIEWRGTRYPLRELRRNIV